MRSSIAHNTRGIITEYLKSGKYNENDNRKGEGILNKSLPFTIKRLSQLCLPKKACSSSVGIETLKLIYAAAAEVIREPASVSALLPR